MATYGYPTGLDSTYTYEVIAASPTTVIPSAAFTVEADDTIKAVSYTHLTLPTILLV